MNEFSLQHFPCFDDKWIRVDLESSLRSPEYVSVLWNNLIRDVELTTTRRRTVVNVAGHTSYLAANGKFYCGTDKLECNCNKNCTGVCHPRSHCNCKACRATVDTDGESARVDGAGGAEVNGIDHGLGATAGNGPANTASLYGQFYSADDIVESWLWCSTPSECFRFFLEGKEEKDIFFNVFHFYRFLDKLSMTVACICNIYISGILVVGRGDLCVNWIDGEGSPMHTLHNALTLTHIYISAGAD